MKRLPLLQYYISSDPGTTQPAFESQFCHLLATDLAG